MYNCVVHEYNNIHALSVNTWSHTMKCMIYKVIKKCWINWPFNHLSWNDFGLTHCREQWHWVLLSLINWFLKWELMSEHSSLSKCINQLLLIQLNVITLMRVLIINIVNTYILLERLINTHYTLIYTLISKVHY